MDKLLDERRISVRMPFVSEGFCIVHDTNRKYCGTLRDISITGLFMEMDNGSEAGRKCEIEIIFKGKHSRLLIEDLDGIVSRKDENGIAVQFDERLEWFVLIPLYFHKMQGQPQL
jgi:hypothetical protein